MSKPVPVYAGSPRPRSPACALLCAPRCLAASRVALPVHGVSTTPATTPQPPLARASRPQRGPDLGSADFCAVDNDVAEVVVRGVVVRTTAGDQVQLGIGYRAVDGGRGEVRLRVLAHRSDPEDGEAGVQIGRA